MSKLPMTAARALLLSCHDCGKLSPAHVFPPSHEAHCPRCGATLHQRKPNSLARAWSLVLAAYILYLPANLFPVMKVVSLGNTETDTIMSGVILFIEHGDWPLAALIFFASVTVPLLKMVGLTFLLISVHLRSKWRPKDRTVLYRVVEAVGRWSMIDVFMISILVALVQLGNVATIAPGIGATSFAAVVILTMFAAEAFDPRLIWDRLEE